MWVSLTGIGPDQPGMVAALTGVLNQLGGNIVDASMTTLAQQFAMILIVHLPDDVELARDVYPTLAQAARQVGLTVSLNPLANAPSTPTDAADAPPLAALITVSGADHLGITHAVAQTLAEAKINISDLNAQQIQGETGPVYLMMIEASLPPGWTCQRLEDLLGPLIAHQAVEISVRELEQLTF